MKRFIAITAVLVLGFAALASAQTTTKPLADVAKDEEARRKTVPKATKVYTNSNLRTDISAGVPLPPTPATTDKPGNASPSNKTPTAPGGAIPPTPAQGQAYWADRIKAARAAVDRTQIFAESLQSRINALTTDFVNRDDPAQKAKLEADRKAALAELERVKLELDQQRKAITAIEEEARRAGVPAGWLRPGA